MHLMQNLTTFNKVWKSSPPNKTRLSKVANNLSIYLFVETKYLFIKTSKQGCCKWLKGMLKPSFIGCNNKITVTKRYKSIQTLFLLSIKRYKISAHIRLCWNNRQFMPTKVLWHFCDVSSQCSSCYNKIQEIAILKGPISAGRNDFILCFEHSFSWFDSRCLQRKILKMQSCWHCEPQWQLNSGIKFKFINVKLRWNIFQPIYAYTWMDHK